MNYLVTTCTAPEHSSLSPHTRFPPSSRCLLLCTHGHQRQQHCLLALARSLQCCPQHSLLQVLAVRHGWNHLLLQQRNGEMSKHSITFLQAFMKKNGTTTHLSSQSQKLMYQQDQTARWIHSKPTPCSSSSQRHPY